MYLMIIKLSHQIKKSTYAKSNEGPTKLTYFLIEDNDLLEKCNTILDKLSDVEKEFDREPVYNKKTFKS